MDGGEASHLNPENMSTKDTNSRKTVNIEKESPCQVKVCKKLSHCPPKGSKKNLQPKGLILHVINQVSASYE